MFYGQIMIQQYLQEPAISFCAIGDAKTDKAPIQITEFGQGKEIDEQISKVFLEGGGGNNAVESYELAAYFYNSNCELSNCELPFFFVTGDEGFYDHPDSNMIAKVFDRHPKTSLKGTDEFRKLCKKFNVFHIKKAYKNQSKDDIIEKQWMNAVGEEHVLFIKNPKAVVDIMLGAIALTSGSRTLKEYLSDLRSRDQTEERITEVFMALDKYNKKLLAKKAHIVKYQVIEVPNEEDFLVGGMKQLSIEDSLQIKETLEKIYLMSLSAEKLEHYEQLKAIQNKMKDKVPETFLCPITGEIMFDPVIASDGNCYDRKAIEMLFQKKVTLSPVNKDVFTNTNLLPNLIMKTLISEFIENSKSTN
jgi:hypothetical protein